MRQVTRESIAAFLSGIKYKSHNTEVTAINGTTKLYLFGNLIAKKTKDSIEISNAGYFTNTTKDRLNGLPNVRINQEKGRWYLNGDLWNGKWTKIITNH